jgi:hypothetical protein
MNVPSIKPSIFGALALVTLLSVAETAERYLVDPLTREVLPGWQDEVNDKKWREEWIKGVGEKDEGDYYYEAFYRLLLAENLDPSKRLKQVEAALEILKGLQARSPDWKSSMVATRTEHTQKLKERLEAEIRKQESLDN